MPTNIFSFPFIDESFRVIFINQVCHEDFLRLMRLSQPEVLVSGDQSLTEALSMGKVILYQTQSWKINLVKQLQFITEVLLPNQIINSFMKQCYHTYNQDPVELFTQDKIQRSNTISHYLHGDTLHKQFKELGEFIRNTFDVKPWIIGKIKFHVAFILY